CPRASPCACARPSGSASGCSTRVTMAPPWPPWWPMPACAACSTRSRRRSPSIASTRWRWPNCMPAITCWACRPRPGAIRVSWACCWTAACPTRACCCSAPPACSRPCCCPGTTSRPTPWARVCAWPAPPIWSSSCTTCPPPCRSTPEPTRRTGVPVRHPDRRSTRTGQLGQFPTGHRVQREVAVAGGAQLAENRLPATHQRLALLQPGIQALARVPLAGRRQQRQGDRPLLAVQLVTEGLAGQRLPVAAHRQIGDVSQVAVQIEGTAHGEEGPGDLQRLMAGLLGHLEDRQQHVQMVAGRHHARQQLRHPGLGEGLMALLPLLAGRALQQLVELQAQGG